MYYKGLKMSGDGYGEGFTYTESNYVDNGASTAIDNNEKGNEMKIIPDELMNEETMAEYKKGYPAEEIATKLAKLRDGTLPESDIMEYGKYLAERVLLLGQLEQDPDIGLAEYEVFILAIKESKLSDDAKKKLIDNLSNVASKVAEDFGVIIKTQEEILSVIDDANKEIEREIESGIISDNASDDLSVGDILLIGLLVAVTAGGAYYLWTTYRDSERPIIINMASLDIMDM